jgi:exosortase K
MTLVSRNREKWAKIAAALSVAAAIKAYYSAASVDGLRWVLAPTTFLVELVTGENFTYENHAGYMSDDQSFLIAGSCSGVNFLIAAFVLLAFIRIWRDEAPGWSSLAYLATLAANTVRIAVAVRIHRMDHDLIWVNPDDLHRLEGIFVYFGFLLLIFVLSESGVKADERGSRDRFAFLRRASLPLLIYWATTLGVPLALGAWRQGTDFWEHFLFVAVTPLILMLPLLLFRGLKARRTTFSQR